MDPERWKRIDALLSAALECEETQRAAFLAHACEGDDELRKEVQTLLSEHRAAGSFLQTPVAHAKELIAAARRGPTATELGHPTSSQFEQTLPSQGEVDAARRGSTLGRYIVLNKLGGGGMGVVYAAYDPELDRKVAVKLLRAESPERRKDPRAPERLLREAQAMARLSHPNVIPVHDVGTLDGQVFIAMEFVEGQTLAHWLKEAPRTAREVLEVFIQAGKGLAAAHAAGLVHRDFKPENVLIGRDGQVKVLDFGLARAAEELDAHAPTLPPKLEAKDPSMPRILSEQLTKTGTFLGTPAYMSPEQLLGRPTDARTDQFSFCVALHEALYGERPFDAPSVEALTEKVSKGEFKEPSKSSRVPGWMRQILLRGLRPNADERYPSVEALLSELRKDPRVARRRALAIGGAVLAVAAVGIGLRQAAYRHSQVCKGAAIKLAGVWDEQRRSALSSAFLGTGKPYAQDAVRAVQKTLDAYANSWVGMHTEACEATRIRGEQSEELLDLRMACLSERREELKSLVELFLNPDAKMVADSLRSAQGLSELQTCANASALLGPLRPPANAESRAKVEELRLKLAQNKALKDAGKISQVLPLAANIVEQAKALHYRPIEAEALVRLSGVQWAAGNYDGARATLVDTVLAAEASGHTAVAAEAWSTLIWHAQRQGRYDEGKEDGKHALALIEHLGGDENLLAILFTNFGSLLNTQGKYDEAIDYQQRALTLFERLYGSSDARVAVSLGNLGAVQLSLGKVSEAIASFQRAVQIDEAALGPFHPVLAAHLNNLGVAIGRQLGRSDEAITYLRRCLAIRESIWGPAHYEVGKTRGGIASQLFRLGHFDEALGEAKHALEIEEKVLGPEHLEISQTLRTVGDILRAEEKYDQALDYYVRCVAIKEKWLGANHPDLASPLTGLGITYLGLHQPKKALEVLERAVVHRKDPHVYFGEYARTKFGLARALGELHREPERARRLALEARDAILGKSELEDEVKRIDTWLAKNYRRAN